MDSCFSYRCYLCFKSYNSVAERCSDSFAFLVSFISYVVLATLVLIVVVTVLPFGVGTVLCLFLSLVLFWIGSDRDWVEKGIGSHSATCLFFFTEIILQSTDVSISSPPSSHPLHLPRQKCTRAGLQRQVHGRC